MVALFTDRFCFALLMQVLIVVHSEEHKLFFVCPVIWLPEQRYIFASAVLSISLKKKKNKIGEHHSVHNSFFLFVCSPWESVVKPCMTKSEI